MCGCPFFLFIFTKMYMCVVSLLLPVNSQTRIFDGLSDLIDIYLLIWLSFKSSRYDIQSFVTLF